MKKVTILIAVLLFAFTCISEAARPIQDTNYEWETIYKKGSKTYDVDINHIYVDRKFKHCSFMMRVSHGKDWYIYDCYGKFDWKKNEHHFLRSLMWKGPSPVPKKQYSIKGGYKDVVSYSNVPIMRADKKLTPDIEAIVRYVHDTLEFYPEKIIWVEDHYKGVPLLPEYDYERWRPYELQ